MKTCILLFHLLLFQNLWSMDLEVARKKIAEVDSAVADAIEAKNLTRLFEQKRISIWANENLLVALAKGKGGINIDKITVSIIEDAKNGKILKKIVINDEKGSSVYDYVYLISGNDLLFNDINIISHQGKYVNVHLSQFEKYGWLIKESVKIRNFEVDSGVLINILFFCLKK